MSRVRRIKDESGQSIYYNVDTWKQNIDYQNGEGIFEIAKKVASKVASKLTGKTASKLASKAAEKLVENGGEKLVIKLVNLPVR